MALKLLLLLFALQKFEQIKGSIPSVADSGIFAERGTQRCNLFSAAFQVNDTSALLAGIVVELECVGRVQREHLHKPQTRLAKRSMLAGVQLTKQLHTSMLSL